MSLPSFISYTNPRRFALVLAWVLVTVILLVIIIKSSYSKNLIETTVGTLDESQPSLSGIDFGFFGDSPRVVESLDKINIPSAFEVELIFYAPEKKIFALLIPDHEYEYVPSSQFISENYSSSSFILPLMFDNSSGINLEEHLYDLQKSNLTKLRPLGPGQHVKVNQHRWLGNYYHNSSFIVLDINLENRVVRPLDYSVLGKSISHNDNVYIKFPDYGNKKETILRIDQLENWSVIYESNHNITDFVIVDDYLLFKENIVGNDFVTSANTIFSYDLKSGVIKNVASGLFGDYTRIAYYDIDTNKIGLFGYSGGPGPDFAMILEVSGSQIILDWSAEGGNNYENSSEIANIRNYVDKQVEQYNTIGVNKWFGKDHHFPNFIWSNK